MLDTKVLDKLLRLLKTQPTVAVGILGKTTRQGQGKTNAEIGAEHEYGLLGHPVRSFLRTPLIDNLKTYLENSKAFDADTLRRVVDSGSLKPWMIHIGETAEKIIQDGFTSCGFGKWKPSDMTHKKVAMTLVETQQLMESISSEVKD